MSPKAKALKMSDVSDVKGTRRPKGMQRFSDLVPEAEKLSFVDHDGETFYIVKVEKKFSNNYGDGYVVSVKDLPNAKETRTTGVYGMIPAKQMDSLYAATVEGSQISLDSPVPVKIEVVKTSKGDSYRFVDPF